MFVIILSYTFSATGMIIHNQLFLRQNSFLSLKKHQLYLEVYGTCWPRCEELNQIRKKEEQQTSYKQHHLLFQIMTMARIGNPKRMKHRAFIQSIADFGWGVGTTAADAFCYFGPTVSSTTRYKILGDLTKDLLTGQKNLLRPRTAVVFVYDKYQKGQQLKFQRGAHSSSF